MSANPIPSDPGKLAEFIFLSQKEFLIGLQRDLSGWSVSYSQFCILAYLASTKAVSIGDIAKKMGSTHSTLNAVLNRLEKLDYICRSHQFTDGRLIKVDLTVRGGELIAAIQRKLQIRIQEAIDGR